MPCAPSVSVVKGLIETKGYSKVDPKIEASPMCHRDQIKRLSEGVRSMTLKPDSDRDIKKLNASLQMLKTSGWFYEDISRHEAKAILQELSEGSFLLRNSADPRYLFALSVQTRRGITSVRIVYNHGKFYLDCEEALVGQMPTFDNVVDLVQFYVRLSKNDKRNQCVWLERTGRRDLPVKLLRPVVKEVPSLQHLCRRTINVATAQNSDTTSLHLPRLLQNFLKEYPHPI